MLVSVLVKELREICRDRRLCAAALVVAALVAGAVAAGWAEARAAEARWAEATRAARENWLGQGRHDPHSAAHHGTYLFKPGPPLAFFDPGLSPYLGTTVRVEAHERHRPADRPARDGADLLRFAAADPAHVLQVAAPLVVVLFGFSAVSRERERGTLALALSIGVRYRTLVLGKAAALFLVTAVVTLPAAVALAWRAWDAGDTACRAGLIGLAYLAYLGGWVFASLAVSARARSSRTALITLLSAWAATTVLLPRLADDVAARLHPLPTQEEVKDWSDRVTRYGDDGKNMYRRLYRDLEAELLERHGVARKEDLPVNFEGASMLAAEEFTDRLHDDATARLGAIHARQDRAAGLFAAGAPYLALRRASAGLAGTDRGHHEAFEEAAEGYRRYLVRTMNEALARKPAPGEPRPGGRELWETVDEFRYEPPGWQAAVRAAAFPLALLVGWWALAAAAALVVRPRTREVA